MKSPILQIEKIHTARSESFCLNIPQLTLYGGRVLCVTGPNGSGKTTFLEHVVGLLPLTSGSIKVLDTPIAGGLGYVRAHIGYIPDDDTWLIKELSAQEYFKVLIGTYTKAGVTVDMAQRAKELAATLHFTDNEVPMKQLSHGNKKKAQIIAALMHEPSLLVVDELRNGLDPLAIIIAEQLVADEAARGVCIVAASHDLRWTERVASEVILLSQGKVVLHRTVADIQRLYGSVEQAFVDNINSEVSQ